MIEEEIVPIHEVVDVTVIVVSNPREEVETAFLSERPS
jgi:hypothetical protein